MKTGEAILDSVTSLSLPVAQIHVRRIPSQKRSLQSIEGGYLVDKMTPRRTQS